MVDDFLPVADADALLAFAVENEARFRPSTVVRPAKVEIDTEVRRSFDFDGALDEWAGPVSSGIRAAAADLAEAAGIAPFPVGKLELTLSAYRDGCFYNAHIDTLTGEDRRGVAGRRLLTAVYYVNRQPPGFTGGLLELAPLTGGGEPQSFAPHHNRLVAFPAFARHRVTRTGVVDDRWENARFSVNCWLHRREG